MATSPTAMDSGLLEELRSTLDWKFTVATSTSHVVEHLQGGKHDVVLSAMGEATRDEALLCLLRDRAPRLPRILAIGPGDLDAGLTASHKAHHIVVLPTHAGALEMILDRATGGPGRVACGRFRAVLGEVRLPTLKRSGLALLSALDDEADVSKLTTILESDPAMAAKSLQFANSSYFQLPCKVSSLRQAIMMLGTNRLRSIAIAAMCFTAIPGVAPRHLQRVRQRGLAAAQLVRSIVNAHADDILTAAIVQDIGQLFLAATMGRAYGDLLERSERASEPLDRLELEALGITHASAGAALLSHWGLPDQIVQAVAFSHTRFPLPTRGLDRGCLVFLVGALLDEVESRRVDSANSSWVTNMGVSEETLAEWRATAADLCMQWPAA